MKVDQQDLMLYNLVLTPKYYRTTHNKIKYFIVTELYAGDDDIGVSDGIQSANFNTEKIEYVPITTEIIEKLNIIKQLDSKHNIVLVDGYCNIYKNNNYIASVNYIHELQNWFYVNCNKFKFDMSNIYAQLNAG